MIGTVALGPIDRELVAAREASSLLAATVGAIQAVRAGTALGEISGYKFRLDPRSPRCICVVFDVTAAAAFAGLINSCLQQTVQDCRVTIHGSRAMAELSIAADPEPEPKRS